MTARVVDWGIGELRIYPYRAYGFAGWECPCGRRVEMKLRKSGKVNNGEAVLLEFTHGARTRKYGSKSPEGHEILKRFEGVLTYADCRIPWR